MIENTAIDLDKIAQLINEQRLDEAESVCRDALSVRPNDLNLMGLMGAIYLGRDEPGKAIAHFRKVVASDESNASANLSLANALEKIGEQEEADRIRSAYMERLPTENLLAEADALCRRGEIAAAEKICDTVLQRDPESTGALRILAMAASQEERFVIAEAFLSRIVRIAPNDIGGIYELARFLGERGRYAESIAHVQRAISIDSANAELYLLLGSSLAVIGRTEASLQAYDRCLELSPDEPAALIGQGHMRRIAGRQEEALASYRKCVNVSPGFGMAWWNLASLPRYEVSDEDVATMRAQLNDADVSAESAVALHFGLARACEKREDFDAAWTHFVAGNAGKRALVSYDPVKTELDQRKIRDAYTENVFNGPVGKPPADATPVFILGVPRSGSTLIEQILASHSQVEGTGELPYILTMTAGLKTREPDTLHYSEFIGKLSQDELSEFGCNYLQLARTHRVEGAPYFTDKMPANFPHVGFIRQILPHARIIDARRGPVATCVANWRQLFALGKNQSYDLVELGEYYVEYIRMMDHWDAVLPGEVLRVQYEDVVGDFENQVRRILEHCGLPFEPACLEFHKSERAVNTASADQVRQPIYQSAVEFWRNYESHLDELLEVLEPVLEN